MNRFKNAKQLNEALFLTDIIDGSVAVTDKHDNDHMDTCSRSSINSDVMTRVMPQKDADFMKSKHLSGEARIQHIQNRKSEIVEERYEKCQTFNESGKIGKIGNNLRLDYKKYCEESDTKFLLSYGQIENDEFFTLEKGYILIFLIIIGENLITNRHQIDVLIDIFKKGKSIFEVDDLDKQSKLTKEAKFNFNRAGLNKEYNHLNPTLFIVEDYEIGGTFIPLQVPNVLLTFGGKGCDNWGVNVIDDSTLTDIYPTCRIHCINDHANEECEKYFYSNFFDIDNENPEIRKDQNDKLHNPLN